MVRDTIGWFRWPSRETFLFKPLELWESCRCTNLRFFRSVPGSWTCTTPFFPIKNLRFFHHDSLQKKGLPTRSCQGVQGSWNYQLKHWVGLMTRKSVPKLPQQHLHQVWFPQKKEMGTSMTPSYKSPWKNNCHVMVFSTIHPSSSPPWQ